MANELEKLLAQQKDVEAKIEELKRKEREPVIAEIRQKIAQFGITAKELGFAGKTAKVIAFKPVKSVAPIYANEEGKTWSGRGKPPLWIAGPDGKASEKLKKKYLIAK
ncbi:DNA-binding protein H-NS [Herbaspirillum sp. Sphag1AN]|uniref:H-NS histone family protein n=1 Tax=unclassified Herbaspirillum TaxID=2624150 RepID=UPI00162089E8|nr:MULTISPECIES: H-NS histone family protein [unclassified Herbaspirillum]MBB3213054.1 DNA-binding protein H-NS [Herbaspirillum sp. Sphag1AN]MBB3246251.1 DNA-binding protein H-NS [Herbaspirillum sp. Sphag64]